MYVKHTVLPVTVGPLVSVPLPGPQAILAECVSLTSTSVNGTHTLTGVSSGVFTVVVSDVSSFTSVVASVVVTSVCCSVVPALPSVLLSLLF